MSHGCGRRSHPVDSSTRALSAVGFRMLRANQDAPLDVAATTVRSNQYREGDVVVFSPAQPTPDGCDCFVRFEADGDTTFKRVFFEGRNGRRIRLQPLNPQYPVRVVDREEVAGMYAAISVVRPVRRS